MFLFWVNNLPVVLSVLKETLRLEFLKKINKFGFSSKLYEFSTFNSWFYILLFLYIICSYNLFKISRIWLLLACDLVGGKSH